MANGDGGGVTLTPRDLYDLIAKTSENLVRVSEELTRVVTLLADTREEQSDHEQRIRTLEETHRPDHEPRIRGLEKWRYGIPVTAVMGVLSLVSSIVIGLSRTTGKP